MAKNGIKIGILMMMFSSEYYNQIYGVSKNYIKLAQQFGEPRIITPDMSPEEANVDLLILPGGPDLSLELQDLEEFPYGQGKDQPTYTYFYGNTLQSWIEAQVPMFGICLGSQALANEFGANFIHDGHGHQLRDEHRALRVNTSEVGFGTKLIDVNSRHHQFIDAAGFPEELIPVVYGASHESKFKARQKQSVVERAKELHYQLGEGQFNPSHVEAFIHRDLPIAAVQWHPEDMLFGIRTHGDPTTRALINWLLSENSKSGNRQNQEQPQAVASL
jgi:gamma-glutamyl-gamma-aminobutyrate hydrolase PuuD